MIAATVSWKDAAIVWWAISWRIFLYAITPPYIFAISSGSIGDSTFWEVMENYFYIASITYFIWGSIAAVKVAMRVFGLQLSRNFEER
jgi:hypothetical protein